MIKTIKYLPVGTICTLKNNDRKIMIVGYYSISYTGIIKLFDYSGILYPEGLLLKNRIFSFNHSDIINIDYMGYIDNNYKKLNMILNKNNNNYGYKSQIKKEVSYNFKFDENGVIIYDPFSDRNKLDENKENNQESISNPFQEKYDEKEHKKDNREWTIFKDKKEV